MTVSIGPAQAVENLKDLTRLVQTTEGFHPLVAALQNGHAAALDGAWGSSGALAAAALGLHAPRALLVVVAYPHDVDGWVEDIASFAGLRPVVFPAWDNLPSEATVIDEVAGQRLRFLRQLDAGEPPRYMVTTIQALMQPVPDRATGTGTPAGPGQPGCATGRSGKLAHRARLQADRRGGAAGRIQQTRRHSGCVFP